MGGRGHLLTLRVFFTLNVVCIKGPIVKIEMNDLRAKGAVIFSLSLYLSLLIRLCGLKKKRVFIPGILVCGYNLQIDIFWGRQGECHFYAYGLIQNVNSECYFFLFKRDTFLLDVPFSENGEAYIEQLTT